MFKIQAFEEAVPREWRGVVRDYPVLSAAAAAAAGFYVGRRSRRFGRRLVAAVVSTAIAVAIRQLRQAAGLRPA
ncbi:MAG TPA: hypothetical protein VK780_01470 [Thermoanaerobaculia bacterium]|jgi:hypothetical protein|nr:hypothetical protein [Thermoanaerobaculia bacterium]